MPKLTIDNREIEVPEGTNVLEAAEKLGIMIPRFCYHPALGSIGACRVCAVMFLEGPVKGLEISCMTAAKDGMVVSTTHPEAVEFRRYVIEWLMLNHPLDCPVCDEGGHCLLQDTTVSGGHSIRRYLGPKRTYHNQDLGLFVMHEMNRCIQCWRCRRFYQDFAGYRDLGAMGIGNRTYFGRFQDGPLESPFAGNLIDVCPTGVYVDKPSRYKGRRWNFERGPSLCIHCSLGCNLVGSARYREMVRLEARLHEAVNGYFICDRGRYGFYYANHADRPRTARLRDQEVPWDEALAAAADGLKRISEAHGPSAVACLGSPRNSLEAQGALKLYCRTHGWRDPQFFWDPGLERKVRTAVARLDERLAVSLRGLETADFILALGADPINEAPMLALALRQAARQGGRIVVLDPRPVFLSCDFTHLALAPGGLEAGLGALVKGALTPEQIAGLPEPARKFFDALPDQYPGDPNLAEPLGTLAQDLQHSKNPVVVCGADIVRETTPAFAADAALLLQAAGKQAGLFYLLPGANAFGAGLILAPESPEAAAQRPAARWPWGAAGLGEPLGPGQPADNAEAILEAIDQGEIKALVLVENDPLWESYDEERVAWALDKLELLVVLDYLPSPTARRAHVLLPTLPLFERTPAVFVNQEGRAQTAPPVLLGGMPLSQMSPELHPPRDYLNYVPGGEPLTPAEIFRELTQAATRLQTMGQVNLWDWLARGNPVFSRLAALDAHPEGLRLLPEASSQSDFAASLQPPETPPAGQVELLLVDWTFGTEELAAYSDILQEAEALPELALHPQDAEKSGLRDGNRAALHLPKGSFAVKVKVTAAMAPGVAVLPRHRRLDWRKLSKMPVYLTPEHIDKVQG
ncbi:MAG: NADH-quinone oxidoreductase subunit NuoG [Deltaproteobacteria bacterium]